jgi:hypothetical protein
MLIVCRAAIGHHGGHRDQNAKESSIARGKGSEFVAKRGPMCVKGVRDIVGEIVVMRAAVQSAVGDCEGLPASKVAWVV